MSNSHLQGELGPEKLVVVSSSSSAFLSPKMRFSDFLRKSALRIFSIRPMKKHINGTKLLVKTAC